MLTREQIDEILLENQRRLDKISANTNAFTGKGCTGDRIKLVLDDHIIPEQYIPAEMGDLPIIKSLQKYKKIQDYLRLTKDFEGLSGKPSVEDMQKRLLALRCEYDFEFWAYSQIMIEPKLPGDLIHFHLNHPQMIALQLCESLRKAGKPIFIICPKSRQWGGSTFYIFYQLWIGLYKSAKHSFAVCAQNRSVAGNIVSMLTRAIAYVDGWSLGLPDNTKLELVYNQRTGKYEIKDAKGNAITRSTITVGSVESPDSLRGYAGEGAHFSEVGVWKDTPGARPEDLIRSIAGGILPIENSMQVLESTPKGAGNFFHREYMRAKNGKSAFNPLFIAWYHIAHNTLPIEDYDAFIEKLYEHRNDKDPYGDWLDSGSYYWYLWETGATLEGIRWYIEGRKTVTNFEDWASESPTNDIEAFQFSGNKVFNIYDIDKLRKNCRDPQSRGALFGKAAKGKESLANINYIENPSGDLFVWAKPSESNEIANRYVVAVDVGGRNRKSDWSVIRVFDRAPMLYGSPILLVAEQRYHTDHDLLAYDAARIARWYNDALLVIESNTLETRDRNRDTDGNMNEYILDLLSDVYSNLYVRHNSNENVVERPSGKYGFHTNTQTKPMIISHLVACIRDQSWIERSDYCCTELSLYMKNTKGQFSAPEGAGMHDDVVMATAIGLYVAFCDMPMPVVRKKKQHSKKAIDKNSTSHF